MWEYLVRTVPSAEAEDVINDIATEGWELHTVDARSRLTDDKIVFYFKRLEPLIAHEA